MGSLVSVIIPTYNRAELVTRAVESVLAQTYPDIEIIVADDGSTDNTDDVLRHFGQKIRYIKSAHSGLPAVSRNIGIRAAKGEFIAFLDDDDEWLPEKLKKQAAVLLNNPKVVLICTNALAVNVDHSRVYLKDGAGQSGRVFENLLKDNFVINSSVLTRRSIIQAEKGFCEEPALKAIEDYHLWLRISLNHEVVYLNELLVIYRDAPTESVRSGQKMLIYWQSMLRIYNEFQSPHLDPSIAKTLKRQRAGAFRNYLKELRIEKEYSNLALAQLKFIFGRYSV